METAESIMEIDRLILGSTRIRNSDPLKSLQLGNEAKFLSKKINDKSQEIRACLSIAFSYQGLSKFPESLSELNHALDLARQIKDEMAESDVITGFGNAYYYLGDIDNALKYHLEGLRLREKFTDKRKIAFSINSVGVAYASMKNLPLADEYFNRSLEMNLALGDKFGIKMAMNNIAVTAITQKEYDKAITLLIKAMPGAEDLPNDTVQNELMINLGDAYRSKGELTEAEIQLKEVELIVKGRENLTEAKVKISLTNLAFAKKEFQLAKQLCLEAIGIYTKLNAKEQLSGSFKLLGEIETEMGDHKDALRSLTKHIQLSGELHDEELLKKTKNLALIYEAEKVQKESEINYLRNVELKKAYDVIKEKKNQLVDSIEYAKYFQELIFAPYWKIFSNSFKDSFCLSLPKDIVSGDFFWHHELNDRYIIVLGDCTGHGVPGAFVSIVANSILNSATHNLLDPEPSTVLHYLNTRFFEMTNGETDNKAGMDATVLVIDKNKNTLQYSGANAGLYIKKQNGEIKNYKGISSLIGKDINTPFPQETISLQKGDSIYLFSDGFHTQNGGREGKRLQRNNFIEMLKDLSAKEIRDQKKYLNELFLDWKGDRSQVDDVTVVGFQI